MSTLEHIVRFKAGHDCIKFRCKWGHDNCIPGTVGSHGYDGLFINFIVIGDDGAVQFVIHTNWVPQFVTMPDKRLTMWERTVLRRRQILPKLWYHSKSPMYEGQEPILEKCEYTNGICYLCLDESDYGASDAMYSLVNGGDEALWSFLETYYEHVFHGGPFPATTEYPTEQRENEQPLLDNMMDDSAPWRP
jgi:hypothetical protein